MNRYLKIILLLLSLYNVDCNQIRSKTAVTLKTSSECKSSAAMNGLKNSIASGLAAACAKTLLAPFDTIKTIQQQAGNGGKALRMGEAARIIMARPKGFLELYVSFYCIIFWHLNQSFSSNQLHFQQKAGLGVAAIGAMPSVGLYFGVYSYSKEILLPFLENRLSSSSEISESTLNTLTVASAAAIGNTVASFSRVPYEVVKQKLQTGEYSSTFIAMKNMFQNGGLRAFFPVGGISIQMIR